jgi:hypothetical protein
VTAKRAERGQQQALVVCQAKLQEAR